jgi:hypothetical protein
MDNKADQAVLEKYLLNRGLFNPKETYKKISSGKEIIVGAAILEDEEMLGKVAALWENYPKAIEAVIKARIEPIIMDIVMNIIPQELTVQRQAMVELSALFGDFERYSQEHIRRTQNKKTPEGAEKEKKDKVKEGTVDSSV